MNEIMNGIMNKTRLVLELLRLILTPVVLYTHGSLRSSDHVRLYF